MTPTVHVTADARTQTSSPTSGGNRGPLSSSREILQRIFGFETFRPGQEDAIQGLLSGDNVLAIFPTGAGKSLCYELPALMFDGITLVISPLIALMKDQVEFLTSRSIAAARLDSSLTGEETQNVYADLSNGRVRLLYISPERLGSERFLHMLGRHRVSLLAVDEAHCISEWGHNFRPDYLKIARLARQLRVERVLALTATARPDVAADIARSFDIQEKNIVHTGFYRPNLTLRVTPCPADTRSKVLLANIQQRPTGPTVVYVTLQRTAEKVAAFLADQGLPAHAYHAGMNADARNAVQDEFMASDEAIVVATIAFGMGVDKANIRYVYHHNLPKSMESYMQEIGRAGRDGAPAVCELLACADDVVTLENFSYGDTPTPQIVEAMMSEIIGQEERFSLSVYDLSYRYDVRPLVVETLLAYLELDEVIRATGPFYTSFRFQPQRPSQEILDDFDPPRAAFLRAVLAQSQPGRTWFKLDTEAVSAAIGEPRERIVKALSYLEERGDLVLKPAGLRYGYRFLPKTTDRNDLATAMMQRFARREENDIARIRRVCAYAEHSGCLTRHLLDYFGEARDDCGHCSRCEGDPARKIPARKRKPLGEPEAERLRELLGEGHTAISTPRQITRFLCGLTSPATTRARLRDHKDFGLLQATPFAEVMDFVRGVIGD